MKIFTNRQYKVALAEEREKLFERERIEREFCELRKQIWDLNDRIAKLEGNDNSEAVRAVKAIG